MKRFNPRKFIVSVNFDDHNFSTEICTIDGGTPEDSFYFFKVHSGLLDFEKKLCRMAIHQFSDYQEILFDDLQYYDVNINLYDNVPAIFQGYKDYLESFKT